MASKSYSFRLIEGTDDDIAAMLDNGEKTYIIVQALRMYRESGQYIPPSKAPAARPKQKKAKEAMSPQSEPPYMPVPKAQETKPEIVIPQPKAAGGKINFKDMF